MYTSIRLISVRATIDGPANDIVKHAFGENNYSTTDETDC